MSVLRLLLPVVIAGLGVSVTFWPPSTRGKKIGLLLTFVVLAAMFGWLEWRQQEEADQIAAKRDQAAVQRDEEARGQVDQLRMQLVDETAETNKLLAALAPQPVQPPPILFLHDIYSESWGLGRSGDLPVNLEAASPLRVRVGEFHRVDPCVMPLESVSNVMIAVTFPPQVETRVTKSWQKWPEGPNTRYAARFGNLDPDPKDCVVQDALLEFRPLSAGRFPVTYTVTGRTAKSGVSLSSVPRRIVIEATP